MEYTLNAQYARLSTNCYEKTKFSFRSKQAFQQFPQHTDFLETCSIYWSTMDLL